MKTPGIKTQKTIVDVIAALYFLLFLYAAVSKLMDYDTFKIQISKSPILTDFAGVLVWMVPVVEILIAIALMVQRTVFLGLYASLALMSVFTAYIIAILKFSETIPCSCGGILQRMTWNDHLIFNIVFILMAVIGILLKNKTDKHKTGLTMSSYPG